MVEAKSGGERKSRKQGVGILYDERMCKHHDTPHGDHHPENPNRITSIWKKLLAHKIPQRCVVLNAKAAEDKYLRLVHSENHIKLIKNISSKQNNKRRKKIASKFDSIYFNAGSSEAAYLAAGSVIEAAERVASGKLSSAAAIVRPPGHHAEDNEAMGFCLFNNVAVATRYILDERPELGIKKILIVDWDVHHGNGTQKMFWKDPSVLVFSVHRHEFGNFYPGNNDGCYKMIGEGPGKGYNINVPWENAGCGDADYLAAWDNILIPVAKEFDPDMVIVSAGYDAAVNDPLGGCHVTPYGYSLLLKKLMDFANGKIVLALEGGYNLDSTANSFLACMKVLLENKPIDGSSDASPMESTWRVIQEVSKKLSYYWPVLMEAPPTLSPNFSGDLCRLSRLGVEASGAHVDPRSRKGQALKNANKKMMDVHEAGKVLPECLKECRDAIEALSECKAKKRQLNLLYQKALDEKALLQGSCDSLTVAKEQWELERKKLRESFQQQMDLTEFWKAKTDEAEKKLQGNLDIEGRMQTTIDSLNIKINGLKNRCDVLESKRDEAVSSLNSANSNLALLKAEKEELSKQKGNADAKLTFMTDKFERKLLKQKTEFETELLNLKVEAEKKLLEQKSLLEGQLSQNKAKFEEEMAKMKVDFDKALLKEKSDRKSKLLEEKKQHIDTLLFRYKCQVEKYLHERKVPVNLEEMKAMEPYDYDTARVAVEYCKVLDVSRKATLNSASLNLTLLKAERELRKQKRHSEATEKSEGESKILDSILVIYKCQVEKYLHERKVSVNLEELKALEPERGDAAVEYCKSLDATRKERKLTPGKNVARKRKREEEEAKEKSELIKPVINMSSKCFNHQARLRFDPSNIVHKSKQVLVDPL